MTSELVWQSFSVSHSVSPSGLPDTMSAVIDLSLGVRNAVLSSHVPEQWPTIIGPSNWFQVRRPTNWRVEADNSTVQITSSDGRVSLTMHCLWIPEDEATDDSLNGLEKLFPVRRNVHDIRPLRISQHSIGLEGEAVLGPETPWWQRVLTKREWRRWRVWAIRQESLRVVAVYLQEGEFDPESDTLVRMILESIEFAPMLADPPGVFANKVLEFAKVQFKDLPCELDDKMQLKLGESTVNLFNFYRSYTLAPEKFDEILEPALSALADVQRWGDSKISPKLDDVRQRIMPMLYPEHVRSVQFKEFVSQPWVGGLSVLYVVDEPQAYWFIRTDLLPTWNISAEELHDIAMQNLEAYFEENVMEVVVTGDEDEGPKLVLPQRPDAYNTARLLSPSFHESMQDILGREFVVGIPNRDFFVALSLDSQEMIDQIRHKVAEDFDRMDHPLSSRLLLVSMDGVSEYGEI